MVVTDDEAKRIDRPTVKGERRPFVISIVIDVILIICLYISMLLFHSFISGPTQYFRLDDPNIQSPIVDSILPNYANAITNWALPICILVPLSLWAFPNRHRGISVLYVMKAWLECTAMACFFTGLLWVSYGSLRPSFLAQCAPDPSKMASISGFYTKQVCTKDLEMMAFQAFPSGHASTSWASWTFILLYLYHHLRPFDNTGHFWKVVMTFVIPLILPIWFTLSRVADFHHTWSQAFWGMLIGIIVAIIAYRSNYVHVTTQHNAHIPVRSYWLSMKEQNLHDGQFVNPVV